MLHVDSRNRNMGMWSSNWRATAKSNFLPAQLVKIFCGPEIWEFTMLSELYPLEYRRAPSIFEQSSSSSIIILSVTGFLKGAWKTSRGRGKEFFICNIDYFTELLFLDNQSINLHISWNIEHLDLLIYVITFDNINFDITFLIVVYFSIFFVWNDSALRFVLQKF